MRAAIGELEIGPRDEIADGARDQDLIGFGKARHPGRDMDRDPADIVALDLDLAGMHAAPDIEVERARRVDDARAAADRARRSVEGREEPVAPSVLTSRPRKRAISWRSRRSC